jgi:putative FmdB family regulatory protein
VPTYQYSCTECGHFFEIVQSFSEDSLTVCPQCEGRLRKVFNAVGVVFKGSGFYRNDSRGTEPGTTGSTTNGAAKPAASTDGSSSTGSSSTPATSGASSSGGSSSGASSSGSGTSTSGSSS